QFAAMVVSIICNPFLQKAGLYPTWHKGMDVLSTQFAIGFDFWISVGAGITFSVALIGLWQLYRSVSARRKGGGGKQASDLDILMGKEGNLMVGGGGGSWKPPKGRGDFPIWIALAMFLVSTGGFVWLCHRLVPGFPVWILAFFGFVWTPLISYVSARMIGLTGGGIGFPFVKEGTLILSGYKGVDIWFAPYPMNDYGGVTLLFKQLDLTRTKFTSIIKAELLMMPLNIVFSFVFWAFFWYLSSIPSSSFPFVDKVWPFNARTSSLWMTATMEGRQWLLEALKAKWIATGLVGGVALYAGLAAFKLPFFLFYGVVSGINAMPSGPIYTLTGALLGRYYFAKRFGEERWFKFAAVLGAGFACGMGLMGMLVVGFTIVTGSVVTKPF
ncbi:MAG: peptide transporter, partial [bacterium]